MAALALVWATSCAPTSSRANPTKAGPTEEPKAEAKQVFTELVGVTVRNDQNQPVWKAQAQSADLSIGDADDQRVGLKGVTGVIYGNQGTSEASRFRSDAGRGNRQTRRLELSGNVRFVESEQGVVLLADRVVYEDGSGLLKAQGNVRIQAASYELGGFEQLWATSDLTRVGTPDAFRSGSARQENR